MSTYAARQCCNTHLLQHVRHQLRRGVLLRSRSLHVSSDAVANS